MPRNVSTQFVAAAAAIGLLALGIFIGSSVGAHGAADCTVVASDQITTGDFSTTAAFADEIR